MDAYIQGRSVEIGKIKAKWRIDDVLLTICMCKMMKEMRKGEENKGSKRRKSEKRNEGSDPSNLTREAGPPSTTMMCASKSLVTTGTENT